VIDEFFVSESGGSRNIPAIPCRREEYVCVCALSDRDRGLRYRLPELGVMSEKDPRPAPFQPFQSVKGGQHRLAVVHVARQAALAEGLTEVAGVGGEHDLTAIGG
jgi:hypothetical protein